MGVDIAKGTLDDFAGRVESISREHGRSDVVNIVHRLVEADLGAEGVSLNSTPLQTYIPANRSWTVAVPLPLDDTSTSNGSQFDIASCQFAMHYMFETRQRAGRFFAEISRNLRPGGYFIATTMDSRVVADWALQVMTAEDKGKRATGADEGSAATTLSIFADDVEAPLVTEDGERPRSARSSDLVVRMRFEPSQWRRLVSGGLSGSGAAEEEDGFGVRYNFTLYDTPPAVADGSSAVDAPEWLVPLGRPLGQLAEEHGMKVAMCVNFHEFITEKMQNSDMM